MPKMFKSKPKDTSDEQTASIKVGGSEHHALPRPGRRFIVTSLVIVLVAAGVLVGWNTYNSRLPSDPKKAANDLYNEALNSNKDANASLAQLKEYGDRSKDASDRATYREAEAETALLTNNYTVARQAASEAEHLRPTADSAASLAYSYLNAGDKENAIKYFKLAAKRSPTPNGPDARSAQSQYLTQAYMLESGEE